jgi:hypothetical protein
VIVYVVILGIHRTDRRNVIVRALERFAVAGFLFAAPTALAACAGGAAHSSARVSETSESTALSPLRELSSSGTPPPAVVADSGGSTFDVSASSVTALPAVIVDSFLWSAAPGQDFLVDNLVVRNPTARDETLSDFDDLTSGLADDVAFVVSATDAAPLGYSLDCGVDLAYPRSLCTISFGQGPTVDSDSAARRDRSAAVLTPGSTAQITLSYGPVPAGLTPTTVSVYFAGGIAPPTDLTP